ncbi:thiamine pyrophosphokinase [Coemansia sp. RSA 2530]|nr:thiamine pyrophosphokinase [Coemansia sp. RSA 2530]
MEAEESEPNKSSLRVVIVKFPSFQVASEWYREIGQVLLFGRILYPLCFSGAIPPAAQSPPNSVLVSVPEMGVKVQVKLGRHNAEVPSNIFVDGADDRMLEHMWRCESTTVWHIRRDVVNVLLSDKTIAPQMQQWLDAEREGLMSVGMAWRRFDRLDWAIPCGALDSTGNFKVSSVNELVVGPQLLEGTHTLELRILEHYPDAVEIDGTSVSEPLSVEGFVMLKRDKKRRTEIVTYRPVLLTSHDSWLFLIKAPRAAQHLDVSDNVCDVLPGRSGVHTSASSVAAGLRSDGDGVDSDQVVCYYYPNQRTSAKQMSLAKYMLNITEVDQIVPVMHDYGDTTNEGSLRSESIVSVDAESGSAHSSHVLQTVAADSGTHRSKAKGKLLSFLRAKKNRQMACKFKLVTRAGATVVLWAANEQCMHEWVRRLTELRYYWINRLLSDLTLRSQVGVLNYALQGRRSREKDMPDWNEEKAWADRAIWHACLNLGCRDIIMSGTLYRKRHRHQGMRKVFCILTRGRIIEYKCPQAPHAPIQSVLAEQIVRRDARLSQLFGGAQDGSGGGTAHTEMSDISSEATGSIANNSEARLLYVKSRSLALRRCYVVSRFIDDLSTNDIMCEPWVMTDIGNYSGLRLADRVYADGVISHELINDCVFTILRPTFVPAILRSGEASEIGVVPDDALGDASELSVDEHHASSGPESRAASPVINGAEIKRSVSFSPLAHETRPTFSNKQAASPPSQPRHHSHLGHHRHSPDTPSQSVHGHRKSSDALRVSAEGPRLSVEGYLSSASNASSGWSSGRPPEPSKPGAYRVGNEIRVSVDDKRDGAKRMSAMAMVSSMRKRVGVYKAHHRICADGGANRLYNLGKKVGTLGSYIPDAIVGDLDSLQEAPRAHYSQLGTDVHRMSDQDSTDFMKSLWYLDNVRRAGKLSEDCIVVVLGGLGGRLDHILHTLKVMFNNHLKRQVVTISDENLTLVLPQGKSKILVNKQVDGPTCGILPLMGESVLTTRGLRWNLDRYPSTFEGLMSTSNVIDAPEVFIESSIPVAWTSEFKPMP